MIFLAVVVALELSQNLSLQNFHGCKMTERWPNTSIKLKGLLIQINEKSNFPWVRDIHSRNISVFL